MYPRVVPLRPPKIPRTTRDINARTIGRITQQFQYECQAVGCGGIVGHANMAERVGFEPTIPLRVCRISSAVPSTTRPPLRSGPGSRGYYPHSSTGRRRSSRHIRDGRWKRKHAVAPARGWRYRSSEAHGQGCDPRGRMHVSKGGRRERIDFARGLDNSAARDRRGAVLFARLTRKF